MFTAQLRDQGQVIPGEVYRLSLVAILTMVVLAIIVFSRRKHIELTAP